MEAFYNKEKHQYILAVNRCGTNFLNSDVVKKLGWKKQNFLITIDRANFDLTATAVIIIRDPFERWCSWFDNFVLAENNIIWNQKTIIQWFEKFEKEMNDDSHTIKQSLIYTKKNIKFKKIEYINMTDLNIFLNVNKEKHQMSQKERFNQLPAELRELFLHQIKKIYCDDYQWIKSLPIQTF
jgi:hypothetical protein